MTDRLMATALCEAEQFDPVTRPIHYCEGRTLEPRHVQDDWNLPAYLFCVLKYLARAGRKGAALPDLLKARQFLDFEIERLQRNGR